MYNVYFALTVWRHFDFAHSFCLFSTKLCSNRSILAEKASPTPPPQTPPPLPNSLPGLWLYVEPYEDVGDGLEEEEGDHGEHRQEGEQMSNDTN